MLSILLALLPQVATDTLLSDIRTNFDGEPKHTGFLELGTLLDGRVLLRTALGAFGPNDPRTFLLADGTAGGFVPLETSNGPLFGRSETIGFSFNKLVKGPPQGTALPDGRLVFLAIDPGLGEEPHVTDGTPAGTSVLGAFSPADAPATGVYRLGERAVLLASTPDDRRKVVVTDGTPAGSSVLIPDVLDSTVEASDYVRFGSNGTTLLLTHYVKADDETRLFSSDGTKAGTVLRATLPGRAGQGIEQLTPTGNFCFFSEEAMYGYDVATHSVQLLRAEAFVRWAVVQGDRAFVALWVPSQGVSELYVTDGTPNGTVLVQQFDPFTSHGSSKKSAAVLGDGVVFSASEAGSDLEPWFSDGTQAGTRRILDLYAGSGSSQSEQFVSRGGEVYFSGRSAAFGRELWRTDGTEAGTLLVKDYASGPGDTEFLLPWVETPAGLLFLRAHPSWGFEPHVTLGTPATTQFLTELTPQTPGSSFPQNLTRVGERAFFTAVDNVHGRELWLTDGTAEGTRLAADIAPVFPSSNPRYLTAFGERVVFVAYQGGESGVWISDGSESGTIRLTSEVPFVPSNSSYEFPVGETQFFFVSWVDNRLWRSDGTVAGTYGIEGFGGPFPSTANAPQIVGVFDDRAVAMAQSDGSLTPDIGWELYAFDGTPTGSQLLNDFLGEDSFLQCDSVAGRSLAVMRLEKWTGEAWQGFTDGQPGVFTPAALGIGGLGEITPFVATDTRVIFGSPSGTFSTDGTSEGTETLTGIFTNPEAHGELVYFSNSSELWRSNGTQAGTFLVQNVQPPTYSGYLPVNRGFVGSEGAFCWFDTDPATGRELWITDGLPGTGHQLADSYPGPGDGAPTPLARAGNMLVFGATTPGEGTELHAVPFALTNASLVEPFGTGCSSAGFAHELTGQGPAVLGGTLIADLRGSAPGAAAVLTYSSSVGNQDLGAGCSLYALAPKLLGMVPVDGAGEASASVGLPTVPALAGLRVAVQAAITEPSGPFVGAFGLSSGLELILGS